MIWIGLLAGAAVAVTGCTKTFKGSVTQPNPLAQPLETLRISEEIVIVTGDMELNLPRQRGPSGNALYKAMRYPLRNKAKFTVVSRDRMRFHVQVEHKWQEWATIGSWKAYLVDDQGNKYVPEQVDSVDAEHLVTMWDQEVRSVRRNRFGDIVTVYDDGHKRRQPLGSLSVFRGQGDFVFYARDMFTPDVKSMTLVIERKGLAFSFTWRFDDDELAPGLTEPGTIAAVPNE
jgi:hypothetical protein